MSWDFFVTAIPYTQNEFLITNHDSTKSISFHAYKILPIQCTPRSSGILWPVEINNNTTVVEISQSVVQHHQETYPATWPFLSF